MRYNMLEFEILKRLNFSQLNKAIITSFTKACYSSAAVETS
jgi:hypothetical protein